MADIHIEKVVEHLSHDMKRALEEVFENLAPDAKVDRNEAFKAFVKAVRRKHSTWVDIPKSLIDARCRKCGEKI